MEQTALFGCSDFSHKNKIRRRRGAEGGWTLSRTKNPFLQKTFSLGQTLKNSRGAEGPDSSGAPEGLDEMLLKETVFNVFGPCPTSGTGQGVSAGDKRLVVETETQ